MAGEALRLVNGGALSAIVGTMARVLPASPGRLTAYHHVVQRLWQVRPAILPVRYGSLMERDELTFILHSRRQSLSRALAAVRGRAQMNVRLIDPVEPASGVPALFRPSRLSGAAYLRSRADEAARARHVRAFDPLAPAVRRWVRGERVERRGQVATVYHLVPRRSADAYHRALAKAAADAGVRALITGPFAPFAFSDERLA